MKQIRFGSTRLTALGKKGLLKPDADGYYKLIVGGLNAYNSAGEYYTLEGAEELFRSSSMLMRRIERGALKSELGHPTRDPKMSDNDFLERVLTIKESNVVGHIRSLELDHSFGRRHPEFKNPSLVAIVAEVTPSGPHAMSLERSISNPSENVMFSIRGLTDNYYEKGRCNRVLRTIVTFDQVTEPGINIANKWDSPALESLHEIPVTTRQLNELAKPTSPVSMESTRELFAEAARSVGVPLDLPKIPFYARW